LGSGDHIALRFKQGQLTDLRASPEVRNIAQSLSDGLPYRPWAANLVKARSAEIGKDWPHSRCIPLGVPEIHTVPEFKKIVRAPRQLLFLDEWNASYRRIFTDGHPLLDYICMENEKDTSHMIGK
jgi:hypothetical protein